MELKYYMAVNDENEPLVEMAETDFHKLAEEHCVNLTRSSWVVEYIPQDLKSNSPALLIITNKEMV